MESFGEWYAQPATHDYGMESDNDLLKHYARDAWIHQQAKINQLQKKLDIAIKFISEQVIIGRHGAEETLEQIREMK